MLVFGAKISYFTGKFEAYLRYKQIPYTYRPLDLRHYYWIVPRHLGATQYPTVRLNDGRWMSDSTPMIEWLEQRHPDAPVMPADPAQRYVALLIEDYADEWLWRPAMHYRWSHADDRRLAGSRLAEEVVRVPLPLALRRKMVTRRQRQLFVTHDGIDAHARKHAESSYRRALECLEPIFAHRPFMMGDRPTIADIGLMGPFWRHFVHDPTPARLMQETAPATFEWAARMWNARASRLGGRSLLDGVPDDCSPLLREIGATHLEALVANALAHGRRASHHDLTVQGTTYRGVPTSAYRVWCLEQLRKRFAGLAPSAADQVRTLLEQHDCWEAIWRVGDLASGHDPANEAPFCQALRMVRD
jgi:glutathione S-transferase